MLVADRVEGRVEIKVKEKLKCGWSGGTFILYVAYVKDLAPNVGPER